MIVRFTQNVKDAIELVDVVVSREYGGSKVKLDGHTSECEDIYVGRVLFGGE